MDIKKREHLSKRVSWRLKKGELKRLTICYGEGFVITSDYAWCEIDFTKLESNVSIWLKGAPFGYMLREMFEIAKFKTDGIYRDKTKVHEATVSQEELSFLLDKIFFDYDLRLLKKMLFMITPPKTLISIPGVPHPWMMVSRKFGSAVFDYSY